MPIDSPARPLRTFQLLVLLVFGFLFLCSCDDSDSTTPPVPPVDLAWVSVNVSPDWVDLPWMLTAVGLSVSGVGDSILALDHGGQYKLYGENGDNLIRDPFESPLVAEVALGDTLTFNLGYAQISWGRLYPETGDGFWYDSFPLENGGALFCGSQDHHPRVAILDRNGELVMNETQAGTGLYCSLIPLGTDGLLLGGHSDDGAILLSARDLSGQELWAHSPNLTGSHSFSDLIPNPNGGYLLLTNTDAELTLLSPSVSLLDGNGQLISQRDLTGALHQVGLSIALRSSGGYYLLQSRLLEGGTMDFATELLLLDEDCIVEQTVVFGAKDSGLLGNIINCTDGGSIFTFQTHTYDRGGIFNDVIRLSPNGHVQWQIQLEIEGLQSLGVCEETPDGNFLLAGDSYDPYSSDHMTWLVELGPSGEVLRNRQANMGSTDVGLFSARTAWDGGLFVAGHFGSPHEGTSIAWANRTSRGWFFEVIPE